MNEMSMRVDAVMTNQYFASQVFTAMEINKLNFKTYLYFALANDDFMASISQHYY